MTTISAEAKSNIANALYMDARWMEDAMNERPGTEGSDVWSNLDGYVAALNGYTNALMELGCDTDELRWIHDRLDVVAKQAERMLKEAG